MSLEISPEEAVTALGWWNFPNIDHMETADKKLVKKLKDHIKASEGT